MITLYLFDSNGLFTGSAEYSPAGPVPGMSTDLPPPETTEGQVAQWSGNDWRVLEVRPPDPPAVVPASVSPRQIRQALNRIAYGDDTLRQAVEAAVAAGDQDLRDWWDFATEFERSNEHVTEMGLALGQTDEQLDDLWRLAVTL